jgi:hypothetical protein
MTRDEIERVLEETEAALRDRDVVDLRAAGFWKAVAAVKRRPELADTFADRIAAIDRTAFERWALLTVPAGAGTLLAVIGTLIALGIVAAAYYVDAPWNGLLLLAGTGVLLVPTHGLGHLVVAGRGGMRITHWFVGSITRPQPGVKLDYATYLRAPARSRAWMHASGAIVTKTIPFLMLGAAWGMDAPGWAWAVLLIMGVAMVITDVAWSTKSSDWMKFRREMRYAA